MSNVQCRQLKAQAHWNVVYTVSLHTFHIPIRKATNFKSRITPRAMAAPARPRTDQAAEVLRVVLQQLPDSWTIQTLCSLMQVSTACRSALLTAGVSCSVNGGHLVAAGTQEFSMARFAGFCAWLPGHASLVSRLDITKVGRTTAAEQLLSLALQSAQQPSAPSASPAATGTITPTGLARHAQEPRLCKLKAVFLPAPATLEALSKLRSFTQLQIMGINPEEARPAACHSLGRLTGIRRLRLSPSDRHSVYPAHFGNALSGLHDLQDLICGGHVQLPTLCQLPAQLCSLAVNVSPNPSDGGAVCVNLSHLTRLNRLWLSVLGGYSEQSELPDTIVDLSLTICSPGQPTLPLPVLKHLKYSDSHMDELRPQLSALPQLQSLVLRYGLVPNVSPALSESLSLAAAAVTQLTSLHIDRFLQARMSAQPLQADAEVVLCETLRQLLGLRALTLTSLKLQAADIIGWTVLSCLTSITVRHCSGLSDTAAAALACKLTALQKLELCSCGLQSPVLWPAFAACSGLHSLCLAGNQLSVDDETLMLLSPMTQLTLLDVTHLPYEVTEESRANFVVAMPQLTWVQPHVDVVEV